MNERKNKETVYSLFIGLISVLGLLLTIIGFIDNFSSSPQESEESDKPSPPCETSIQATIIPPTPTISSSPLSIYGQAVYDANVNGTFYSIEQKMNIIYNSYYGRKDANGNYNAGYSSDASLSNDTGYRLSFYYGDGLIYYAEVINEGQIMIKLYYWDEELIACQDLRGYDDMHYSGDPVFESIASEYANVYSIGMS